jgi:hypothetical protein
VQQELEWLVIRAALAVRRATWLTRLMDVSVVWTEPGSTDRRLLVVDGGEIVEQATTWDATPPVPPGHARAAAVRRAQVTVASFDRVRVLSTELKRLAAAGAPVAVRFGPASTLADARLASALSWV